MADEEVLVIPEGRMELLGGFKGFRPFCEDAFQALLNPEFMQFRPRSQVEEDPSFKQLIPYVILQCEVDGATQVFQYTRGKGQGESGCMRCEAWGSADIFLARTRLVMICIAAACSEN